MKLRIEDELLRGFVSGVIAGLVMIVPNQIQQAHPCPTS